MTGEGASTSERGVLRPEWGAGRYILRRIPPSPDLAHVVERYWITAWDVRGMAPHPVEVLPHPAVNLAFFDGISTFSGPGRKKFTYVLHGRGKVFGVKLRPGAGYPFVRVPLVELADAHIPLAQVFGPDADELTERVLATDEDEERMALVEEFLRPRLPEPDPQVSLVVDIVRRLLTGPRALRVEDVARDVGVSMRSLQRIFRRYVGVTPKQVLMRYRLHEAADRIAYGQFTSWAQLAADLGYVDQAHFVHEFTRAVGQTPTAYLAVCVEDARMPVAG